MDPNASARALLPADPHAASDSCPPWLVDRLDDLLQEMEMLNTWLTPAPSTEPSAKMNANAPQSDSPDLYCGDAMPSYYTPRFRDLPKS